jgi:hypothetical protein
MPVSSVTRYGRCQLDSWGDGILIEAIEQAVGISAGEKGGIQVISKKSAHGSKPAKNQHSVSYGSSKGTRK